MKQPVVDLRSDTVTKPTKPMLEAMFSAEVGDDVFDEDPTIKELEEMGAKMLGQEAGIFCPSGTMTNQIAIRILTQPQEEIICDREAYFYYFESGGIASNSGVSLRLVAGDRGRISASQVEENINPPHNIHMPLTSVVAVENTSNKGGGSIYRLDELKSIHQVCKKHKLKYHLDGARIFNALAETGEGSKEMGSMFDTISVCLSKGLGAPVGSLLLSSKENIMKAKRVRKSFGGNMRQAGYLAAAGIYALKNNVGRLKEDHTRARAMGNVLQTLSYVEDLLPVETNIIVFRINKPVPEFLNYLSQQGIRAVAFGKNTVRMVTHLHIDDEMTERTIDALKKYDS